MLCSRGVFRALWSHRPAAEGFKSFIDGYLSEDGDEDILGTVVGKVVGKVVEVAAAAENERVGRHME